jgi:hypothetical protein
MPVHEADFDAWFQPVCLDKDIDYDVYGSYIVSILSEEGDVDSKKEAISEILQSFMEDGFVEFCEKILQKWSQFNDAAQQDSKDNGVSDVTHLITTHLSVNNHQASKTASAPQNDLAAEDRAYIKQSVIAMYNKEEGDDEEEETQLGHSNGSSDKSDVFRNTNASSIVEKEKQERSKQKDEAAKKKERDKQERKNQLDKKAERKEKEKKRTQKKEKNR